MCTESADNYFYTKWLFFLYLCLMSMKTEWEALELTDHQWALEDVEEELMAKDLHFEGMFKEELQTSIFWIWEYAVGSSGKRHLKRNIM